MEVQLVRLSDNLKSWHTLPSFKVGSQRQLFPFLGTSLWRYISNGSTSQSDSHVSRVNVDHKDNLPGHAAYHISRQNTMNRQHILASLSKFRRTRFGIIDNLHFLRCYSEERRWYVLSIVQNDAVKTTTGSWAVYEGFDSALNPLSKICYITSEAKLEGENRLDIPYQT